MRTLARVKVTGIGSATPARRNFTDTFVPGVPFKASDACAVVQPRALAVSI